MTAASNEVALLPCPFCGGEWGLGQEPDDNYPFQSMWYLYHKSPRCFWNWSPPHFANRDAAVFAWNHRIAHSDPRPVAEGLREALGEARETILELIHARDCQYEGTDEEAVGFIDAALATHSPAPMAGEVLALRAIKAVTATAKDGAAGLSRIMAITSAAGVKQQYTDLLADPDVSLIVERPRTEWAHLFNPEAEGCAIPPAGWYCTRARGHTGPCAAHPSTQEGADRG